MLGLALACLALHVLHGQAGLGGHGFDRFADDWLYDAVIAGGAASCLLRGCRVREGRLAWLLIGAGLACDAAGEVYYSLAFGDSGMPPIPSLADLLYLLYYPAAYAGLLLLMRARLARLDAGTWLDGGIAAATMAALLAAVAFEPILHSAVHQHPWAVATTLAYPVGDLVLLGVVFYMFALSGWRPERTWLLLGLGLAVSAIADTEYVLGNADGTYVVGGWLDSLWVLSAILTGASAWQPVSPRERSAAAAPHGRTLVIPGVLALLCVGLLMYGGVHHVGLVGLALAALALVLVVTRAGLTFRENGQLLERSRAEALTDALTGLGNRRQLNASLEAALAEGPESTPAVLVMFDLNGFKLYNDSFGHLAGDTLLSHLGRRLAAAVAGTGSAYRLGGDEFCVLLHCDPSDADMPVAAAVSALGASGERFSVSAAFGRVTIPAEAATPTQALRLADDRMYSQKSRRPHSARQQAQDVLLGVLREREPDLHLHLAAVAVLAVEVGRRLGLDEEQLDELRRAAELHDIGKAAIPDAILSKPGPLTAAEQDFMRRHTLVGERILAAAPALAPVAALVRASHERWDGTGYPDRIGGEQIPLGARIVAVCDAFDAMTNDRPYARARSIEAACEELRRCAGTQFDPVVVETFEAALDDWQHQPPAPAGAAVEVS